MCSSDLNKPQTPNPKPQTPNPGEAIRWVSYDWVGLGNRPRILDVVGRFNLRLKVPLAADRIGENGSPCIDLLGLTTDDPASVAGRLGSIHLEGSVDSGSACLGPN